MKTLFGRLGTIFVVAMATVAPLACGDDGVTNPAPSEITINMDDDVFEPVTATVAAGGTVTWVNVGNNSHTSTGESWDSQDDSPNGIGPGEQYERTFSTAGTYEYRCFFHNGMTGTLVVE